jgi:hypothetical protein
MAISNTTIEYVSNEILVKMVVGDGSIAGSVTSREDYLNLVLSIQSGAYLETDPISLIFIC